MGRKGFLKSVKYMAVCVTIGIVLSSGKPVQASSFVETDPYTPDIVLAKDDIASGTADGCKWVIDKKGKLTVRAAEKNGKNCDLSNSAWAKYKDQIVTVDIDVPYSSHLQSMFYNFENLTEAKVKIDRTSGSASSMFSNSYNGYYSNLEKIDVSKLNTSGITDMSFMFCGCNGLEELDLSTWDTSNVTDMRKMFDACYRLNTLDLSGFNTSKVINMSEMFDGCGRSAQSNLILDVSKLDTKNVTNMRQMFGKVKEIKGYEKWNTSNVEDMSYLFYCTEMKEFNLSKWDVSKVKNMENMFQSCEHVKSINLKGWDTSNVTDMEYMLAFCDELTDVDVSGFDTSSLQNIGYMFKSSKSIKSLDLSNFDLSKLSSETNGQTKELVYGCSGLQEIKTPKNLQVEVRLPYSQGPWYRSDTGEEVTTLMMKQKKSFTLLRKIFDDLTTEDWQYEGAKFACDNNIMTGKKIKSDKLIIFDAKSNMTRAEFVQTLYNFEGTPIIKYSSKFTDVPVNKWYTKAVLWAAKNKIVAGKGRIFDVDGRITRQEMAVMLYNYANYKKMDVSKTKKLNTFADYNQVAPWATQALEWTTCNKIMNGKPPKSGKKMLLDPLGNATRGEAATILKTFVTLYREK